MSLVFIVSTFCAGYGISKKLRKDLHVVEYAAMAIGIGFLISGWIAYLVSYIAKVGFGSEYPKVYGNVAAIASMAVVAVFTFRPKLNFLIERGKVIEWSCFLAMFLIILGSMFYVFRIKDNYLLSGVSVFSDYAPHTAMIRSFSWHDNFPTQYAHFGGEDIKYHFMFQFLVGNLEYLGMRIDWAFNLMSAAGLWGFLVLLCFFAKRICNSKAVGVVTVFMFFFRSSFAGLEKLVDAIASNNIAGFLQGAEFVGYTAHEDWGLWNYNVFLNQRHLGFALLVAMIVISYFAQNVKEKISFEFYEEKVVNLNSVWFGLILGALSFWNGAVVVATLLILFGFTIFSKNKLDYLVVAVITVILTLIQTSFFIDGGMGMEFLFGFIADDKTILGILVYLIKLSGIFFPAFLLFFFIFDKRKRAFMLAFFLPIVFAFTISMTPDVTVNHKYIMISVIFLNIFWANFIVNGVKKVSNKKGCSIALSATLLFLVTFTGIYDMLVIYNKNKGYLSIDQNSELTKFLKENVKENELVLGNHDAMTKVSLSGVMMFNGWPYYAWSAGYDTDARDYVEQAIYSTEEPYNILKENGIDYVVVTPDREQDPEYVIAAGDVVYDDEKGTKVVKID